MKRATYPKVPLIISMAAVCIVATACLGDDVPGWQKRPANFSLGGGMRVTAITEPINTPAQPATKAATKSYFEGLPEPPMAGFSPYIVIAASDEADPYGDSYEHKLEPEYTGRPLNAPMEENYIIGIYDSGSVIDLAAGSSAVKLGLTSKLTDNTFPLGGVGGDLEADISWPVGIFAGGLQAIGPQGAIDPNYLVGHSNVSLAVTPEISCGTGESITGVVGTPFLAFYTAVIKNDEQIVVNVDGQRISGPRIDILELDDPSIPTYPRSIPMQLSSMSLVTTASFYPDFEDIFASEPMFPTMLSMSAMTIPFGGSFFTELNVLQGEPGPLNTVKTMRVMVDTGAQMSIMSSGMAAELSLPLIADYYIDVCGVGGTMEDVPVYFIDYVKMNAWGGAMEFTRAPFVILDLGSPDGLPMDGVLGMNLFWNRNIVFEPPSLMAGGDGFLHVSEPVSFANVDFSGNGVVDLADFAYFAESWMTDSTNETYRYNCDIFLDDFVDFKDFTIFIETWLDGAIP